MLKALGRFILASFILTVIAGLPLSPSAYAEKPGGGPMHEIIVSQDGDGDFTTIQQAFVSITNASADNRYLITVKPGFYDWNYWLNLDYIYINGSGIDNTRVRVGYGLATASNTRISNITLIGISTNQPPIAIYDGGNIALDNVHIEGAGAGVAISVANNTPTNITLKDTTINGTYGVNLSNANAPVTLSMENVKIDSQDIGIVSNGYDQQDITIKNSSIKGTNAAIKIFGYSGATNIDVFNSSLIGTDALLDTGAITTLTKIAGSMISGNINAVSTAYKLVNSFDANFNPIANH